MKKIRYISIGFGDGFDFFYLFVFIRVGAVGGSHGNESGEDQKLENAKH